MMNDELTPEVLAELRGQLERKRAHLQAQIRALHGDEASSSTQEAIDEVNDTGDNSVDLEQLDRDLVNEDDVRADLKEVEHALAKFDQGTYGICEECGRPIPLARLRVIPEARYDAQHQAEVEARGGSATPR